MPKENSKTDPAAKKRQAEYARECRKKLVINCVGYSLLAVVALLMVLVFGGERFDGVLRVVGLKSIANAMTGVYADCSKAENRGKGFCESQPARADRQWSDVVKRGTGRNSPFSIN